MSEIIKAPRGTFDVLPEEVPLWLRLEGAARDAFRRYGYREMRTPLLEQTRLFVRGIGETTDIVEKEMYTFTGKGREDVSLRPEATAGIVRAYIEHNYHKKAPLQKFCYAGVMFRYERPQAGRQRQFSQIGVEVLGTRAPEADVETVALALDIFKGFGLPDVRVKLNSLGCRKCRPRYREVARKFIGDRVGDLCGDCQRRYERNIFRVLDCKVDSCRAIIGEIPEVDDFLCVECGEHSKHVESLLGQLELEYVKDKFLVRGFDYYTKTVYEITHDALGARDAVCGGGRYDNLVEDLGGPPTGAVGFSVGSEATILALRNAARTISSHEGTFEARAMLVLVDGSVSPAAFKLLGELRSGGVAAQMPFEIKSVKAQMRAVGKANARVAVILGPDEVRAGSARVKDMATGAENVVALGEVGEFVKKMLATPEE